MTGSSVQPQSAAEASVSVVIAIKLSGALWRITSLGQQRGGAREIDPIAK